MRFLRFLRAAEPRSVWGWYDRYPRHHRPNRTASSRVDHGPALIRCLYRCIEWTDGESLSAIRDGTRPIRMDLLDPKYSRSVNRIWMRPEDNKVRSRAWLLIRLSSYTRKAGDRWIPTTTCWSAVLGNIKVLRTGLRGARSWGSARREGSPEFGVTSFIRATPQQASRWRRRGTDLGMID